MRTSNRPNTSVNDNEIDVTPIAPGKVISHRRVKSANLPNPDNIIYANRATFDENTNPKIEKLVSREGLKNEGSVIAGENVASPANKQSISRSFYR
jgi:hypothetical protein